MAIAIQINTAPEINIDWRASALCAQTDPALFHPDRGQPSKPAQRVCAACPVRVECLEAAIARDERYGVWGGMSERQRRAVRRQRRRAEAA